MAPIEITETTTVTLSVGMLTMLAGAVTAWVSLRHKVDRNAERVTETQTKMAEIEKDVEDLKDFATRRRRDEEISRELSTVTSASSGSGQRGARRAVLPPPPTPRVPRRRNDE